jgi:hypothetical protein
MYAVKELLVPTEGLSDVLKNAVELGYASKAGDGVRCFDSSSCLNVLRLYKCEEYEKCKTSDLKIPLTMLLAVLGDEREQAFIEKEDSYSSRHCVGETNFPTCYLRSGQLDVPLLYAYCAPIVFKYQVLQQLAPMNLTQCGVSFEDYLQPENKSFL